MNEGISLPADLNCLSLLFSYPDQHWAAAPIPAQSSEAARARLKGLRAVAGIALQNEYVRLFINSLPSLPCPPYGSVYLEGSVVGRSTMELKKRYQMYDLSCTETADHIAVQCEFLALLFGIAGRSPEVAADYDFVLDHLSSWAEPFFDLVDQHDRLGAYRQCAAFGQLVLTAARTPDQNGYPQIKIAPAP